MQPEREQPSRSGVYTSAEGLEAFLGDPDDPATVFSFARVVDYDEREERQDDFFELLRRWGFAAHLVPRELGGELTSFEQLFALFRALARRDASIGVSMGSTLLGANMVWAWGDAAQQARVARWILDGELGGFALSEATHGSDILASETTAAPTSHGWALTGEKWPIGNPQRGRFTVVFARVPSPAAPGDATHALFLVDKRAVADHVRILPRVKTVGLRAHDMGGLAFDAAPLGRDAMLGDGGRGVEQALKGLQITKTLIGAMSLGAADTGLRLAHGWAARRTLYGKSILELPAVDDLLAGAYLDVLACEVVALATMRAFHVAPEQTSLWSAIAKVLVPTTCDQAIRDAATVIGARFYFREGLGAGVFQKLQRDAAIASVFEGTTHVNLQSIASQLRGLAEERGRGKPEVVRPILAATFAFGADVPRWTRGERLRLGNVGRDDVVQDLDAACAAILDDPRRDAAVRERARPRLDELVAERAAVTRAIQAEATASKSFHASPAGFALAERYARLWAAAACAHAWAHAAPGELDPILCACLPRVRRRPLDADDRRAALARLDRQRRGHLAFSLRDVRLGGG